MELLFLVFLIFASGMLAMAEMAVGASNENLLSMKAEAGEEKAQKVLDFRKEASRLLATTQLGITALAMLSGVFGEASWAPVLEKWFIQHWGLSNEPAYVIALSLVVIVISFVSIVFGEVIPKRLALMYPEKTSMILCGFLSFLLSVTKPLVFVISKTSDF
ncbi:MAG TPA: CNNM domain-containing protein, partial [Ignavibacteriaceae bacterium]